MSDSGVKQTVVFIYPNEELRFVCLLPERDDGYIRALDVVLESKHNLQLLLQPILNLGLEAEDFVAHRLSLDS